MNYTYGTPYNSTEQSFYKKSYATVKVHKRKIRKKRKARKQSRFKVSYRSWYRHMKTLLTDHVKTMDGLALDCEQLDDQLRPYHQVIANTRRFGDGTISKVEIAQSYIRAYENIPSWHSDENFTTAYRLYKALWNNLLKMNSTYKSLQRLKSKKYRVKNFKKGRIKHVKPYNVLVSSERVFSKGYANYTLGYTVPKKRKYYSLTRNKTIKVRGLWNDFVRHATHGAILL